ncbi:Pre-mRNA-splicing factor isy-1 [Zea mays]|uniref:Pre-mRNA-splicing factor isy-1 n=2 Tax=Zea mays TaxID=4577 RepID=A0A1D6N3L4_MAIZE|nr:Pre-mRNA-splicing factor isy-1 [Zea mays]
MADQQHLKLDDDGLEVHLLVDRGAHISTTSSSSSGVDMRSKFSVGGGGWGEIDDVHAGISDQRQIYGSLLRIFVGFSKDRRLSTREKQVRAICQTRLHQHIKENAAYWKQRGYQKAIRDGDANTAFHHAHATQRSRSNHISKVTVGEQELYSHESKMAALTNHVRSIMGQTGTSTWSFDVNELYDGRPSASDNLTAPFSEKEAVAVIAPAPENHAPATRNPANRPPTPAARPPYSSPPQTAPNPARPASVFIAAAPHANASARPPSGILAAANSSPTTHAENPARTPRTPARDSRKARQPPASSLRPLHVPREPPAQALRAPALPRLRVPLAEIQNEGLGEHRLRDLNDEINKLLRERGHWERHIVELNGRDYSRSSNAPLMTDLDGNIVAIPNPSGRGPGYRYFGAARKLPGVQELFDKPPEMRKRCTRYKIHKRINAQGRQAPDVALLQLQGPGRAAAGGIAGGPRGPPRRCWYFFNRSASRPMLLHASAQATLAHRHRRPQTCARRAADLGASVASLLCPPVAHPQTSADRRPPSGRPLDA